MRRVKGSKGDLFTQKVERRYMQEGRPSEREREKESLRHERCFTRRRYYRGREG